ncbi:hypothetical protein ACFL1G_04465 [Planctomycetota bacterium]
MNPEKQYCSKCFMISSFPNIEFNEEGLCHFCEKLSEPQAKNKLQEALNIDKLEELETIADKIKREAREKKLKYDCIIGASGGFDSTYVIYVAKKLLDLNPLVIKYDNGICHELANTNLKEACKILGVDLIIEPVTKNERGYILNATKALLNLGVFFTACFSCHYIIASVAYWHAKRLNIRYMLTGTNHIEKNLAQASHGFMLKSLIKGCFRCNLIKMLKIIYYEVIAQYYFVKLKYQYDGFSLRFFRNLFRLHPVAPHFVEKIDISEYVGWNWPKIENILREELHWDTPRRTRVPYFRFDCHFSALIDKSFKRVTGLSEHALLCNWFAQSGFVSKEEIRSDFNYMNDDTRIDKEIRIVMEKLDIHESKS